MYRQGVEGSSVCGTGNQSKERSCFLYTDTCDLVLESWFSKEDIYLIWGDLVKLCLQGCITCILLEMASS